MLTFTTLLFAFCLSFFFSVRTGVSGPVPDSLALRLPEGGQPLPQERGPDHAVSLSLFHVCKAVVRIHIRSTFNADPDPAFLVKSNPDADADPDPDKGPGF
jgi:hypothetical protein